MLDLVLFLNPEHLREIATFCTFAIVAYLSSMILVEFLVDLESLFPLKLHFACWQCV